MIDSVFVALALALFFSRVTYVVLNFADFGFDILKFILINGYPGLSVYGGLFGGVLGLYLFLRGKKVEFRKAVDYYIPGLFVATAIGFIGSFFAGVDVGTKTKIILAVKYVGYTGSRHIVAVYQALFLLAGAYLAHRIVLLVRRQKLPSGFAFYFFLFYFAVSNLLLDKFKENHLYFAGFNFNLIISAVISVILGGYFAYFFRKELISAALTMSIRTGAYVKKAYQGVAAKVKKRTSGRGGKSAKAY